jgi:CheY-like chemotaxis protein
MIEINDSGNRPRVLIVDDELVVLESVKKVLEYLGLVPDFAEDIPTARLRIAENSYAAFMGES